MTTSARAAGTASPNRLPTVYECSDCGQTTLERRCPECNLFTTKLGPGGNCPSCEELITLADLADNTNTNKPSYTENLTSSPAAPTPPR